MWRRRLITAGLLTVALAATVWAELKYQPAINTSHPQPNQTSDQIHNAGQSAVFSMDFIDRFVVWTELHHDFVIAIGTVFLALFTLALFAATWGLLRAAKIQAGDMQNLLVAAKENTAAVTAQVKIGADQHNALQEQARATAAVAEAAGTANEITNKIFISEQRPWISVTGIDVVDTVKINVDTLTCEINVRISVNNPGRTPAINVLISLFPWPTGTRADAVIIDWLARTTRSREIIPKMVVFPGEGKIHTVQVRKVGSMEHGVSGNIIGIAEYQFAAAGSQHMTGFQFFCSYGRGVAPMNIPLDKGDIPGSQIAIQRYMLVDFAT